MKMNECTSRTWSKMAEIPTDDFSIEGIARALNEEFGEQMFDDILEEFGEQMFDDIETAIADGYIQVCDDGIIVWCS